MSIIGISYVAMPSYYDEVLKVADTIGYRVILLVISILYLAICIVKISSLFQRTKDYAIKTEDGIVYISANTVTTYIRELLASDRDVSNIKVDTYKKGKKFNIIVKLAMASNGNVSSKSMSIQNEVKTKLADKMGIEVGDVQVKIAKLSIKADNMDATE